MKLVKFKGKWALTAVFNGWRVMEDDKWRELENKIRSDTYPKKVYVGKMIFITYKSADEFLRAFRVDDITLAQISVLERFFDENNVFWPDIDFSLADDDALEDRLYKSRKNDYDYAADDRNYDARNRK